MQYRLGPLGFLSTESPDIPGNVGFVDVVFALEWICSYVASFGGDPNRVTVFGQGSGAAIASALLYWNRWKNYVLDNPFFYSYNSVAFLSVQLYGRIDSNV